MARCFPCLPRDYVTNLSAGGEPLVESIKLQKGKEKAEERKKDEREKKERREKSKEALGNSQNAEPNHKKRQYDKRSQLVEKDGHHTKATKGSTEQLEKSSLTEENGLPCSIPNPHYTSDSTQDSSKKRKLAAPDVSHNNNSLIIRIKLPLQKHKDAERPATKERPCFLGRVAETLPLQKHRDAERSATEKRPCFSGRVAGTLPLQKHRDAKRPVTDDRPCFLGKAPETLSLQKHRDVERTAIEERPCFSGRVAETLLLQKHRDAGRPGTEERPCFSGRVSETLPLEKHTDAEPPATGGQPCFSNRVVESPQLQKHTAPGLPATTGQPCSPGRYETAETQPSSGRKCSRIQEMERQYRGLVASWNPPPFQFEFPDVVDGEWLFGTKQGGNSSSERSRASAADAPDLVSGLSSSRYLPEFNMYQLPYVVPY